jgi:hypothetical protein
MYPLTLSEIKCFMMQLGYERDNNLSYADLVIVLIVPINLFLLRLLLLLLLFFLLLVVSLGTIF